MSSFISIPSFAQNVRIGKFRLIERLGRGGMGEVWKAEDTTLKRNVALKVIVPEFALRDDIRSRFLQEAQSAAQVEHERIVRIFEVGEDQRIPYIAMELLRGEDLATYLEREPIPPLAFTLKVVAQVLQGLSAAHTHPIKLIHRDIKPQNVWLEAVEEKTKIRCKILDFGIAKSTVSGRQQTQSGMVIGTLEYMSAEQLNAEELDARADLYSVGVMFYQMLTGQFPYQSPTAAMRGVEMLMTKPPTPQEWNSSVPKALSDFVMRMIAVKRQNRPSSAMESIELLGRGVGNLNEMGKVPTSESVLEHFEERTATAKPKPISQRAGSTGSLNRDPKPEKPPHPVRPIPPSRPSVRSRTKDKRWRRALEQFPTPTRRDSIGHPVAIFVGVAGRTHLIPSNSL